MEKELYKLEIGCGKTKTEGYVGIDRFALPGVDIVADLNKKFPVQDNAADVIYACHSLEHLDNIEFTMNEIFRIGKHGCIIQVLAPYYYTTLNLANFYHKSVFNEDTFRFFTTVLDTEVIDKEEWYTPSSWNWGLSESDNSEHSIQMELLNMEFFYYKEYLNLTNEQKRRARRSFNNVCDNIYYELVINKSGIPFTKEEIKQFQTKAKRLEPPIMQQLRNRDENTSKSISIYDDINKNLDIKINKVEKQINHIVADYENKINSQRELINSLSSELKYSKYQNDKFNAIVLDLYKVHENKFYKRIKLFKKSNDLFNSLHLNHRKFIDGIVLNCDKFKNSSMLNLSQIIPYVNYFEYEVSGCGDSIYFFTISNVGATIFVEIVKNNEIIKQDYLVLLQDGVQRIQLEDKVNGKICIRFKTVDNSSFIKILEIVNRKGLIFSKRDLASLILSQNEL